jgi:hypothetical protein
MSDAIPAIAAGVILFLLAVGLAYREWTVWSTGPSRLPKGDEARDFAHRRLRRRCRVSLLLGLVGVMIPVGDVLPIFHRSPRLFVIHWLSVLALVVIIILLALGDLASSLAFNRKAQAALHRERRSLQEEIRRYREEGFSRNGRGRG